MTHEQFENLKRMAREGDNPHEVYLAIIAHFADADTKAKQYYETANEERELMKNQLSEMDKKLDKIAGKIENNPVVEFGVFWRQNPRKAKVLAAVSFLTMYAFAIAEIRHWLLSVIAAWLGIPGPV